jgi:DUF1365 family protein
MSRPAAKLYVGEVWHKRWRPVTHAFKYNVLYLLVDVAALDAVDKAARLPRGLSFDRFNLFSVHAKDHLAADGQPLGDQVHEALQDNGIDERADRILMLSLPRVLGYVFNPISVFYCLRRDGSVFAMLYEVNNTFGAKHLYVFPVDGEEGGSIAQHGADKKLHVSPFFDVAGDYRFRQLLPSELLSLGIVYRDSEGKPLLSASLQGEEKPLTSKQLAWQFIRLPFLTVKVTAAIHWEAIRLWWRGITFVGAKPSSARRENSVA